MKERRLFKQTTSLKDRLSAFAAEAREKAASAIGAERGELLEKARRADAAVQIDDWVSSPGLRPRRHHSFRTSFQKSQPRLAGVNTH